MKKPSQQAGLTLIELMIALVIGLFIVAGVAQIYLSGRAAANLQDRISNLQSNGRFAQFFLLRSLQKAGYQTVESGETCSAPIINAVDGASGVSDTFTVCYEGGAGVSDCLGVGVASGVVANDRFEVQKDAQTGTSRLRCQPSRVPAASAVVPTQPLIDGIESMQVQYGIDRGTDSFDASGNYVFDTTKFDGLADVYLKASDISSPDDWKRVASVRIAVLASTNSNDASVGGGGRVYGDVASDMPSSYPVLDESVPASAVATGGRGQVFTTTMRLRNQLYKAN